MKKIFTLMLMAVVACAFVACNSPESRIKKIIDLEEEQAELLLEISEINADVKHILCGMSADDIEDAQEDIKDYCEDAEEELEDEFEDVDDKIEDSREKLYKKIEKVYDRYRELDD